MRSLPDEKRLPFMFDPEARDQFLFSVDKTLGFDVLDPLLGWGMSEQRLIEKGFNVMEDHIVLESGDTAQYDPLVILISGGSTTDPAIIDHNWPIHFRDVLHEQGIRSRILISAVGGYNSGQELLKLLRDIDLTRPHVHISYSGANEGDPCYVSNMERDFYYQFAHLKTRFPVFSNTFLLLYSSLYDWNNHLQVRHYVPESMYTVLENDTLYGVLVRSFWLKNIQSMHGLSKARGYHFVGILQPVMGSGRYQQELVVSQHKTMAGNYIRYYPHLQREIQTNPIELCDMSAVFDTVAGPVYTDDCHLHPAYQPIIAKAVFDELMRRKLFEDAPALH